MNIGKCQLLYLTKSATCIFTHFDTSSVHIIILTSAGSVLLTEVIGFARVHVFCILWVQCTVCEVVWNFFLWLFHILLDGSFVSLHRISFCLQPQVLSFVFAYLGVTAHQYFGAYTGWGCDSNSYELSCICDDIWRMFSRSHDTVVDTKLPTF